MEPLKATVKAGRLVLDEPTDLPEGTVIELYPGAASGDALNLTPAQKAKLDASLTESIEEGKRGEVYSLDEVLSGLRPTP